MSLCLSVHTWGGYPYPIMLCNITQNAMGQTPGGEYPARSSWGWRVPCQVRTGGTLLGAGRVPPSQVSMGGTQVGYPGRVPLAGYPPSQVRMEGTQVGYPPWQGTLPGQVRTTEGVLTTRRAVCLLRSRRRTFFFIHLFGNLSVSNFQSAVFCIERRGFNPGAFSAIACGRIRIICI